MYTVEIINTVSSLDEDQWDGIGDSPFSSYGWLKTVEETHSHDIEQKYVLVKNRQRLVGGAVYYIAGKNERISSINSELLGRIKNYATKLGISFLPAMICGSRGEHLLVDNKCNLRERRAIMKTILDAIFSEARKKKLPICFPYLDDNEQDLMTCLKKEGFNHTLVIPYMSVDIKWPSFEAYIKDLVKIRKNMKKKLKGEINRNKKAGVRIEIEKEPGKYEDRIFELINKNYLKHTGFPIHFNKEFVHQVQENLGQKCRFYISWKNGLITGTGFSLIKNGVEYVNLVAVDRKLAGNDMTFFKLLFHIPMIHAISDGLKRIDLGLGMVEMKARYGCDAGNLFFYYKTSNKISNIAIKPWFLFLSKWYQRKNALSFNKSR